MLGIISNYISSGNIRSQDQTDCIAAKFLKMTATAPADLKNYLFSSKESNLHHSASLDTKSVLHLTGKSLPSTTPPANMTEHNVDGFCCVDISDSIQPDAATTRELLSACGSTRFHRSFIDEDPRRFYSIKPDDYDQGLVSPSEPGDSKHPSVEYDHALSGNMLPNPADDHFPEEDMMSCHTPMSIPPESLRCFETPSMVYVPGEAEHLDIFAIEIIEGSELARLLGVSGEVRVDKVFYEAGTGAIIAQVLVKEKAQSFTLFSIKSETNLEFALSQYQLDTYLAEVKKEYDPHYEFFREKLKESNSRQVMGNRENNWRRDLLKKKLPTYMHPKAMTPTKQYLCNSGVCSVTNKDGIDICEAVKIRMYQQEEKLACPPKPVTHSNIESTLKDIARQKSAWAAAQRDASRLNIQFDIKPEVSLTAKQAETVKMLKDKRALTKAAGANFTANDVVSDQTTLPESPVSK